MGAEVWPTVNIDIEATFSRVPGRNFTTRVITRQRVPGSRVPVDRPIPGYTHYLCTHITNVHTLPGYKARLIIPGKTMKNKGVNLR